MQRACNTDGKQKHNNKTNETWMTTIETPMKSKRNTNGPVMKTNNKWETNENKRNNQRTTNDNKHATNEQPMGNK